VDFSYGKVKNLLSALYELNENRIYPKAYELKSHENILAELKLNVSNAFILSQDDNILVFVFFF
jgi:hypothetical protein